MRRVLLAVLVLSIACVGIQAQFDTVFKHIGSERRWPANIHVSGDTVFVFNESAERNDSVRVYRSYDRSNTWDTVVAPGVRFIPAGPSLHASVIGTEFDDHSQVYVFRGDGQVDTLDTSPSALSQAHGTVEVRQHPSVVNMFLLRGLKQITQSGMSERLYIRRPGSTDWFLLNVPVSTTEARSNMLFEFDHSRPERFWVWVKAWDARNTPTMNTWVTNDMGATFQQFDGPLPAWAGIVSNDRGFAWSSTDTGWMISLVDLESGATEPLEWSTSVVRDVGKSIDLSNRRVAVQQWSNGNYASRNATAYIDPRYPNRVVLTIDILPDVPEDARYIARVASEDFGETWHVLSDPWPTSNADTVYHAPQPVLLPDGIALIPYSRSDAWKEPGDSFIESAILKTSTPLSVVVVAAEQRHLAIAPNPARELVSISVGSPCRSCPVTIQNVLGQTMWEGMIDHEESEIVLSIVDLFQGMYVVTVGNDQAYATGTLMIAR